MREENKSIGYSGNSTFEKRVKKFSIFVQEKEEELNRLVDEEFSITSKIDINGDCEADPTGEKRRTLYEQISKIKEELIQLKERSQVSILRSAIKLLGGGGEDTFVFFRALELLKIRKELLYTKFTSSVGDVAKHKDYILMQIQAQQPTLLEGPTGTGKTELLIHIVKTVFKQEPEVLRCTERTGPSDIFGKTLLKTTGVYSLDHLNKINQQIKKELGDFTKKHSSEWEQQYKKSTKEEKDRFFEELYHKERLENDRLIALYSPKGQATETYFQPGAVPRAMEKNIPLILDEFNNMPLNMRFALKEIYNRKKDDEIIIQENSGKAIKVPNNFTFLATANLKGDKHKDRFELDDAEIRVYNSEHINYMKEQDQYDICLANLMDTRGFVPLSFKEIKEVLVMLVKTAVDTQKGYTGKLDRKDSRGKQATLENAVFDPGQLFSMVKMYRNLFYKKDFLTYLDDEILRFVNKAGYEKDRGHLVYLFQKNGFLGGKEIHDFNGGVSQADLAFSEQAKKMFKKRKKDIEWTDLESIARLDIYKKQQQIAEENGRGFLKEEIEKEKRLEEKRLEEERLEEERLEEERLERERNKKKTYARSQYDCFPGSAQVLKNNGETISIKDIKIGDKLISYNEEVGKREESTVSKNFSREVDSLIVINKNFEVTSEHPFAVVGGESFIWKKARDLVVGDKLFSTKEFSVEVVNLEEIDKNIEVYNMHVSGLENYFVILNKEEILVHNKILGGGW